MVGIRIKGGKRLEALAARVASVPAILKAAPPVLAEECVSLVREGFAKEADPYGKGWAPKKVPDGRAVGVVTGAMKGSAHAVSSGTSFGVGLSVNYAQYFNAKRLLVPTAGRGLPASWVAEFEAVIEDMFEAELG